MTENSIYGRFAGVLPEVLKEFSERLEDWNRQQMEKTGHSVWEHLVCRVKEENSMREKCRRRGLPETPESALLELNDSIGIRIVTRFVDDIYRVADHLREMEGVSVREEKDYIRAGKPNGYRSYHMILEIEHPEEDIRGNRPGRYLAEIQLRTIAMDTWASLEHEMYYKKKVKNQSLIASELKRCADELASCDLTLKTIRDLIREESPEEEEQE